MRINLRNPKANLTIQLVFPLVHRAAPDYHLYCFGTHGGSNSVDISLLCKTVETRPTRLEFDSNIGMDSDPLTHLKNVVN